MLPALLVIDLQRYFLEVGHAGKLAQVGALIARTNELIDLFHDRGLRVAHVRTVHQADGSTWNQAVKPHWTGGLLPGTLIEGTREAQPHPGVHTRPTDLAVIKTRGSAFLRTDLDARLAAMAIDTLVLAGYSIDRCVGLTAIDAWERDFRVILAGEAILGTSYADGQRMLDYLRESFGIQPVANERIRAMVADRRSPAVSDHG